MSFLPAILQKIKWRSIFIQLLLLIIIFAGVSWYQQRNVIHGIAADISARLINGRKVSLSQYQGRPVLLHFWATWCPVCKLENSNIQNIAKDYQVLSIASWSGSHEDVARYMQKEKLSFPVIVDDDGVWAGLYGISAVPVSFVIDANGEIQFVVSGYSPELALRIRLWWLEKH